jgi:putative DNA primase/helicase
LRRDGFLLAAYGYDHASGLFNDWRDGDLGLSAAPSKAEALEALDDLLYLLREFAFATGDDTKSVDRAVALSALTSPVLRGAMDVCPLHGVTAPAPGSGKSFLIDVAAMISTGRRCPVQNASVDEVETEKRLVSMMIAGLPIASLDNVNFELQSDLLSQAVERPLVHLRPLGSSASIEVQTRGCFFANGNGFGVRGDLGRRTLICRLDPKMERPEKRTFRDNPLEMVAADRGRHIRAALQIALAFLASAETLESWGSIRLVAIPAEGGWSARRLFGLGVVTRRI